MGGNGKINKEHREDLQRIAMLITGKAIDQGHIVELGFAGFLAATYPDWQKMGKEHLEDLRNAFFGGAQHLFSSIMATLDPEEEPTERDLRRMAMIEHELDVFLVEFAKRHGFEPPGEEAQPETGH